jgi:hypothetical protein
LAPLEPFSETGSGSSRVFIFAVRKSRRIDSAAAGLTDYIWTVEELLTCI